MKLVMQDFPKFERDMQDICKMAIHMGADTAMLIESSKVATDSRVTLKCRIPPCVCYGVNLMCPPYSPTAEETKKILSWYKYAVIFEVSMKLPKKMWERVQADDTSLQQIYQDPEFLAEEEETEHSLWMKQHNIINSLEREAHNRGYFFATGFGASDCELCSTTAPSGSTTKVTYACPYKDGVCVKPYEARPSMEASGIDVFSTWDNIGRPLKMASLEKFSWTGLVLIV